MNYAAHATSSRNQNPADYFYSAATHRSRGVLWPIFTPARILTGLAFILALILVLARVRLRLSSLALPIALIALGLGPIAASGASRPYLGNWHLQLVLPAVCGIYAAAYIAWRRDRSLFSGALLASVVLLLLLNLNSYRLGFTVFGPGYRNYVSQIEHYILSYTPSSEKPFPHPGSRDIDAEMIQFLRDKHHPLFAAH